jgi:glucose-1-phosphate adenylyltransferase
MNYATMLNYHILNNADCTIASLNVTMEEASRFGILNTREDGSIYEFEEKPKKPKSTLASMGIYIFKAEKLYKYLEIDEKDENSKNDFGQNVLPNMLNSGEKMMSYEFSGYWKDVGTISSLYEANMDLLGDIPNFDVADASWKIRSRNPIAPPHYIGEEARVVNSIMASGCEIEGEIENSVLSHNVVVEKGAKVKNSIIFSNVTIKSGATVEHAIIDEHVVVGANCKVGETNDNHEIAVIGREVIIADGKVVEKGQIIDKNID